MKAHVCKPPTDCICSLSALEPHDQCPQHGQPWPPRCDVCQRYLPIIGVRWMTLDQMREMYPDQSTGDA